MRNICAGKLKLHCRHCNVARRIADHGCSRFYLGRRRSKGTTCDLGDEKVQKELDGPKRKPLLHEKIAPPVVLDACAGSLSALPEEREDSDSEFGKVPSHNITAHICSHIIFLQSLSEETTTETTTEDTTHVDVQGVQ